MNLYVDNFLNLIILCHIIQITPWEWKGRSILTHHTYDKM